MYHPKPVILVSTCIEHSKTRFDNSMSSSSVVKDLKGLVKFIPVCPEMAIGLPSPREAIRLAQKRGERLTLISSVNGIDYTDKMSKFSKAYLDATFKKDYDGFILKAKSPTCGIDKIKVYRGPGKLQPIEPVDYGMFAREVISRYKNYPVESERRLSNFNIREHFYIRIFTTARFKEIRYTSLKNLVEFHTVHKYLFMTYNALKLKKLGSIVANSAHLPLEEVFDLYYLELSKLFSNPPQKKKRVNTLFHVYGYFKDLLPEKEKAYYLEVQHDYEMHKIPYSTPLSLIKGYSIRFNQDYLLKQYLFEPYPKSLLTQLDSGKKL